MKIRFSVLSYIRDSSRNQGMERLTFKHMLASGFSISMGGGGAGVGTGGGIISDVRRCRLMGGARDIGALVDVPRFRPPRFAPRYIGSFGSMSSVLSAKTVIFRNK